MIIGIGAAVVVIVAIVIAIVVANSGGNTPVADNTTSPSPTPTTFVSQPPNSTPASSPVSSPPASGALTAGQQKLIANLPHGYSAANCVTGTPIQFATAGLECKVSTVGGPSGTFFYLFPTQSDLDADFQALMIEEDASQSTSECPALGWKSYKDDGSSTVDGDLACYIDKGTNTAQLAWSDYPDLILGVSAKANSSTALSDLSQWWFSF
jgi:hypothetical protein